MDILFLAEEKLSTILTSRNTKSVALEYYLKKIVKPSNMR